MTCAFQLKANVNTTPALSCISKPSNNLLSTPLFSPHQSPPPTPFTLGVIHFVASRTNVPWTNTDVISRQRCSMLRPPANNGSARPFCFTLSHFHVLSLKTNLKLYVMTVHCQENYTSNYTYSKKKYIAV